MAIHVLVVNAQLSFVVNLKKGLERAGAYEVHPFTAADTALDYLRYHPQDVALLDFNLPDLAGVALVERVRALQRDLPIIISPKMSTDVLNRLGVQGTTDVPISARDLIPLLLSAMKQMATLAAHIEETESLALTRPDTSPITVDPSVFQEGKALPTTEPDISSLDSVLVKIGGFEGGETLEFVLTDHPEKVLTILDEAERPPAEPSILERLAAEEPPMPDFEDSGTIGDLRLGMTDSNLHEVLKILRPAEPAPRRLPPLPPVDEETAEHESSTEIPAQTILETTLDESTPIEALLEQAGIDEPEFLLEVPPEYTTPTTEAAQSQPVLDPQTLETDRYSRPMPRFPIEEEPALPPDDETGVFDPREAQELEMDFERLAAFEPRPALANGDVSAPMVIPTSGDEDPLLARLALHLTQSSLELTAEATVLARDGQIVSYAGTLPREEIEDLRAVIADDWQANLNEARVRFITFASSGKDYMLYSRRTDGGYTLSMIFSGTTPLRVIRRQGQRLIDALYAVPEPAVAENNIVETPAPAPVVQAAIVETPAAEPSTKAVIKPAVAVTPYTYLWLLRDPKEALSTEAMHGITQGLRQQMAGLGWETRTLQVAEDYVYLVVDAPDETPPPDIVRDLKRRAALLVEDDADPSVLWADSYLVVTPGRELTTEEIQQFIAFERM